MWVSATSAPSSVTVTTIKMKHSRCTSPRLPTLKANWRLTELTALKQARAVNNAGAGTVTSGGNGFVGRRVSVATQSNGSLVREHGLYDTKHCFPCYLHDEHAYLIFTSTIPLRLHSHLDKRLGSRDNPRETTEPDLQSFKNIFR